MRILTLKISTLIFISFFFAYNTLAQELDCKVSVISQKIAGVDGSVFKSLEQRISDLLNSTEWTNLKLDKKEKIKASFILTIDDKIDENTYQANLQIHAERIVFNSSYTTPLLNHKDNAISFTFLPNEAFQYSKGGRNNELVAVIAYYAYLIIGINNDSFSKYGGTDALRDAQNIVMQQSQGEEKGGWAATDRKINRYNIVENLLNYKELRQTIYSYHREGLDKMVQEPRQAMENLIRSIKNLDEVYSKAPTTQVLHLFFDAKAYEISQSMVVLPPEKRTEIYTLLTKIDPGHLGIYKVLK